MIVWGRAAPRGEASPTRSFRRGPFPEWFKKITKIQSDSMPAALNSPDFPAISPRAVQRRHTTA